MDEIEKELWAVIDQHWGEIFTALKSILPMQEHIMFTEEGEQIPSQRPMIESIVCDKQSRSRALLFYLAASNIVDIPEMGTCEVIGESNAGGNIYKLGCFSTLQLRGYGGKPEQESK